MLTFVFIVDLENASSLTSLVLKEMVQAENNLKLLPRTQENI